MGMKVWAVMVLHPNELAGLSSEAYHTLKDAQDFVQSRYGVKEWESPTRCHSSDGSTYVLTDLTVDT